jgi:2-keto-3-deoxy-L-rhamnonate aldolase RhmA
MPVLSEKGKMTLVEKLRAGQNVYGTSMTASGPHWPAAAAKAGLDFVFLDTEHIPQNREQLSLMCQLYKGLGIAPIVRIPSPDPYLACQAIDAGAAGVVAPYLESVEQVQTLVGATKYRPLKGEKLDAYLSGKEEMPEELRAYITRFNANTLCIANIESVPALERLDELLSVPGVDGVFIGPHDLSVSLGVPEQYDHPVFEEAVISIIRQTRAKGLAIGIHFSLEPERQIRWVREGANIIVHSFDIALFAQRLRQDMDIIRQGAGDAAAETDNAAMII